MTEADTKPDVLHVTADETRAEVCQSALRAANLANRIVWVTTAAEGRDFLFGEGKHAGRNLTDRPRVVFLELMPPIEEGVRFIHAIKADEVLKRVPIVVLAASETEHDISECYKNGGNSFVDMLDTPEQFGELIKQIGRYWLLVNRSPG